MLFQALETLKDELGVITGLEKLVESREAVPTKRLCFYREVLESAAEAKEASAARLMAQIRATAKSYPSSFVRDTFGSTIDEVSDLNIGGGLLVTGVTGEGSNNGQDASGVETVGGQDFDGLDTKNEKMGDGVDVDTGGLADTEGNGRIVEVDNDQDGTAERSGVVVAQNGDESNDNDAMDCGKDTIVVNNGENADAGEGTDAVVVVDRKLQFEEEEHEQEQGGGEVEEASPAIPGSALVEATVDVKDGEHENGDAVGVDNDEVSPGGDADAVSPDGAEGGEQSGGRERGVVEGEGVGSEMTAGAGVEKEGVVVAGSEEGGEMGCSPVVEENENGAA